MFALFFYSMPTFLLGLLLLYFLYFQLTWPGSGIFPAGGYVNLDAEPGRMVQHLILPWFTLALVSAATYTRLTRGVDARRARRGLHPHRAVQGDLASAGWSSATACAAR